MKGKKRVVPRETCVIRAERRNHHRKVMLNTQESAEVIVALVVKDRINRSLEYDPERRNEQ